MTLLRATDVAVHHAGKHGLVRAVDGVSLEVEKGETLGIVGESGCGKTTLGRALVGLVKPVRGTIEWKGEDLVTATPARLRALRRGFQIVFQDNGSALDPRQRIGDAVAEGLVVHGLPIGDRVRELVASVGLGEEVLGRFPHELSGGQRQRIGLARALAVEPELIVADEPVSALDVSVQAQVVNLLQALQGRLGLAFVFISHDLRIVEHVSHRVAVMYLGKIVETAPTPIVLRTPGHPYTRMLLGSVPGAAGRAAAIGEPPSALAPPTGCAFHPRCPYAIDRCRVETPVLAPVGGAMVACHRAGELVGLGRG